MAFIDSTEIPVCHRKRIKQHKVFANEATLGKSSKGWFLGFKLHLVANHKGELVAVRITPGNVDDRKPVRRMTQQVKGKLFGDKGYISKVLFNELADRGLLLVTSIRKT